MCFRVLRICDDSTSEMIELTLCAQTDSLYKRPTDKRSNEYAVSDRRALDWFEVLGYRVLEDKATDYAHLKQALSEQFPVVRNMSELETRFYSSSQKHNQKPSDFVYDLLKIHKILKVEMTEEKLIDHIIRRLEPQILDYVEIRNPQTTSNLLQIIDKYEERFLNRKIRGIDKKIGGKRGVTIDMRTIVDHGEREFNRFESQGVVDNQRFDGRRRGGQSDHRFHNQGGRSGGSRSRCTENPPATEHETIRVFSLRMTQVDLPYVPILLNETFITALWDTGGEIFHIGRGLSQIFSYRPRQKTKDRVVTAQGTPVLPLRSGRITDLDPRIPERLGIQHS
ncbi:uncharacterized protein TNCV_2793341 [Trichonephila clavipes]|nr:uncharacterized protein TNCV_2793341 [Trichonephila clavipes]